MAEPINHFADVEDLGVAAGKRRCRARVHAYPRYYRDGDPVTGPLRETDCTIVPSDHPELSDWMAKRGVWSLYGRNSGQVCYKHLGRALVLDLRALVVVKADRSFEVIAQPNHAAWTISGNGVTWLDCFFGVDRQVQAIPDQFRDVFTISPEARTQISAWLQSHAYAGQLNKCYLAFAYKLTPLGFDAAAQETFDFDMDADGLLAFDQETAKETFGRFNFKVAGRVKQFIDPGAFTAIDDPAMEQASVPKLKRFFRYQGDWWLLEGARLDQLAALPAGRIRVNTTATFQEGVSGYTGGQFSLMSSADADRAYRSASCAAGRYSSSNTCRTLLKFDVSSIDPTATVTTATFTLTYTLEYNSTNYYNYLCKMLKAWIEPTADHNPASDVLDEPCWSHQYYDETAWTTAGAGGEDTDRDTDIAASAPVTSASNTPINFQSESMDALVEDWIQGTVTNNGLLVYGDEGGDNRMKEFASNIHATAGYRPLLTIDYTLPGTIHELAGTIAGQSSAAGALARTLALAGTIAGQSSAAGGLARTLALAGTIAGQSSAAAALARTLALAGTIAGQSSAAAALAATLGLAGSIDGSASAAAALAVTLAMAGVITGQSGSEGDLEILGAAAASIAAAFLQLQNARTN